MSMFLRINASSGGFEAYRRLCIPGFMALSCYRSSAISIAKCNGVEPFPAKHDNKKYVDTLARVDTLDLMCTVLVSVLNGWVMILPSHIV